MCAPQTALPVVDYTQVQGPAQVSTTIGNSTELVYGLVYEDGVTSGAGQGAGITAELGYGAVGSIPDDSWTWTPATYHGSAWSDSADVYRAALIGTVLGSYHFAYRFSIDAGGHWIYADLNGNDAGQGGDNHYSPSQSGQFLVTEEPEIVMEVSSIDMTLPANTTGARALAVFNDGIGPLGINFTEDIDWLAINPATVSVEPQEYLHVSLAFDATALIEDTTYSGTILWASNDPDDPSGSITIDLHVIPEGSSALTGFVRGPGTGIGVSYAGLQLYQSDTLVQELTAGSDGFFAVYGLAAGTYLARVTGEGYYPAKVMLRVPDTGALVRLSEMPSVAFTNESVNIYSSASTFDDTSLQIGDVITVRDPDNVLCGMFQVHTPGEYGFMHVYADDPNTTIDEGAESGDTLAFFINDFPAQANGPDVPVWTANNDVLNIDLIGSEEDTFILWQNWNLVSFTSLPENDSVSTVLAPITDNIIRVSSFDLAWNDGGSAGARTYDPALPQFSDLHYLDPIHGYWIKMSAADTLTILGSKVYDDTLLPLEQGWNLTSYLPENSLAVEDALQSIAGSYAVVSGFDQGALTHVPGSQFNDFTHMVNGLGYWIRMNVDDVLIYRGGAQGGPGPSALPPGPALASMDGGEVIPTPLWTDYYGQVELPVGAILEAYDPDGVLCGVYTVRTGGQYGFLHVYGDDAATPMIDEGAGPGDVITFMHNGVVLATTPESLAWTGTKDVLNLNTNGALGLDGSGDGLP